MIPKKSSILYKPVAEELNISETFVEDLISFYYKEVRQNLSNLVFPRINIEGLGHFIIRTKLVRNAIPRYTNSLENHDTSTFAAYYNKKGIETKLDLLIELDKIIQQQELKKINFIKNKNEKPFNNSVEE